MKTYKNNPIAVKSKTFALRIIRLYDYLTQNKIEFVMAKQILRSGTSIGANIREGLQGQSKADFGHKLNIALKEASETEYWLELLNESGKLTDEQSKTILEDCRELIMMLTSIVKTTFSSLQ